MIPRSEELTEAGSAGTFPRNVELIYNDELLESLSTIILLGAKPGQSYVQALPEIRKALFDYDIYMVSFMTDEDVEKLCGTLTEDGINGIKIADKKLMTKLIAIRDNARTFVNIASAHNSVRAYIDRSLAGENREECLAELIGSLTDAGSDYKLKQVGSAACKKFLDMICIENK